VLNCFEQTLKCYTLELEMQRYVIPVVCILLGMVVTE